MIGKNLKRYNQEEDKRKDRKVGPRPHKEQKKSKEMRITLQPKIKLKSTTKESSEI